jgi:TRAP transporter TAXI family solute receptor
MNHLKRRLKMGKRKGYFSRACLGVFLLGLISGSNVHVYGDQEKPVNLSIATFKSGSSWFVMAQGMAKIIKDALPANSTVDVLPYSGGVGNPLLLHQGKADLALCFPVETGLAMKGEPPYKEPIPEIRVLATGFDTYWYAFAVREDTGIKSFSEIKEKRYPLRLAILPKGSSGEWMTGKVLEAYGMELYKDLEAWGGKVTNTSFPAAIEMMQDGQANAFGQLCTPGHPSWTQLATMVKVRFLPIEEKVIQAFEKKYGFNKSVIPRGTFRGVTEDVPVLGFATNLITTDKLPEDVAYRITKALATHKEELVATYKAAEVFDPKKAWSSNAPLHSGAEKFYRESGYMK